MCCLNIIANDTRCGTWLACERGAHFCLLFMTALNESDTIGCVQLWIIWCAVLCTLYLCFVCLSRRVCVCAQCILSTLYDALNVEPLLKQYIHTYGAAKQSKRCVIMYYVCLVTNRSTYSYFVARQCVEFHANLLQVNRLKIICSSTTFTMCTSIIYFDPTHCFLIYHQGSQFLIGVRLLELTTGASKVHFQRIWLGFIFGFSKKNRFDQLYWMIFRFLKSCSQFIRLQFSSKITL